MIGPGELLAAIAAEERPPIAVRAAVVLAHPDDETLACGALLPRLAEGTLIHVTDGAPRNGADAAAHGLPDVPAYAAARLGELDAALLALGATALRRAALDVPDQEVALALADIARRLVPLLGDCDVVFTHALEGGHPDHDATAFAVGAAAELLAEQERSPVIFEMPLYHAAADGSWARGVFADALGSETVLRLNADERVRKAAALACFATQEETLGSFGVADERFRVAPPRDILAPPGGRAPLYERHGWGMTFARFAELAAGARHELGLEAE